MRVRFGYPKREGQPPSHTFRFLEWSDSPVSSKSLKTMAATIGAGALIAGGALTMASNSWAEPAEPAPPGPVPTEEATVGETTTETTLTEETPPPAPTTSSAVPGIEGPAALPPEQEDAL